MIDEKVKEGFMKAYEWMLGVQKDLMFKQVTVEIRVLFTKANFIIEESHGWTVKIIVCDEETGRQLYADWTPWHGDNTFLKEKAVIDEFVRSKVKVDVSAYGDDWSPVKSCPKTPSSWLCATIGGDQIWVDETEWKKFLLKDGQWYECAI